MRLKRLKNHFNCRTSFFQANKDEKEDIISPKEPEEECIPCGACEAIRALKLDLDSSEDSEEENETQEDFGY
jgi:hypothetical protein